MVKQHLNFFKRYGMEFLERITSVEINNMVEYANKEYHGKGTPTLTDTEYDIIKEYLVGRDPIASSLQEIGTPVTKKKVTLPVFMPSMDKIKPETLALSNWTQKYKGPYIVSCKLDGVSGMYYNINCSRKLFTRGDGRVGQDVSKLLEHIHIPFLSNVIIRGEFIIKKSTFNEKYKTKSANIRNMVAGLINQKKMDPIVKDVEFIAYEVIFPLLDPSQQMVFLESHHFRTVRHDVYTTLTNEMLSDILVKWREEYMYEIDGIIVSDNNIYERTSQNPKHSFAFKMVISDQIAETQVVDVLWSPSKDGYLKPRVRINPVTLGGVTIEYATGFNGQFIEENKIGVGAVIKIIRSGDVIPYIKEIIVPAEKAKMPEKEYKWTATHVDIIVSDKDENPVVLEKRITSFFTGLEVEGLSTGNVKRLVQCGYNSIPKVILMEVCDFLKVEGFQEKMAIKIHTSLHKRLKESSLTKILACGNCLGRGMGERRIKPIFEKYPRILIEDETKENKCLRLLEVNGIGYENAKSFVDNLDNTLIFLEECGLMGKLYNIQSNQETPKTSEIVGKTEKHPIFGKKIVFTGFRDKCIMELLEKEYEVTFGSSIQKDTYMVIIKTEGETNKKTIQALQNSIPVLTYDKFKDIYLKKIEI